MSRPPAPSSEAWLRRYARQIVLPEIGEAGQRRIGEATVRLSGRGDALVACAVHLASAGVGSLEICDPSPLSESEAERFPFSGARSGERRDTALAAAFVARALPASVREVVGSPAPEGVLVASSGTWTEAFRAAGTGPVAKAEGALAADAILRRIVGALAPSARVAVAPDGTVRRRTDAT